MIRSYDLERRSSVVVDSRLLVIDLFDKKESIAAVQRAMLLDFHPNLSFEKIACRVWVNLCAADFFVTNYSVNDIFVRYESNPDELVFLVSKEKTEENNDLKNLNEVSKFQLPTLPEEVAL